MKIKNNIPNFLTLMNLLCGCIAISMEFQGRYFIVVVLIFIAALFDFADGLAARLLNAKSNIGKDLDSLSDLVSFGVLPGFILYRMISNSANLPEIYIQNINIIPFTAFLIPLMSALRLAKFNNDSRQSNYFLGLATPANTLFIASLSMILLNTPNQIDNSFYSLFLTLLTDYKALVITTIALSAMLIIPLPLISLKFQNSSKRDNVARIIFLGISLILIILFKWTSAPFLLTAYILVSLIFKPNKIEKKSSPIFFI